MGFTKCRILIYYLITGFRKYNNNTINYINTLRMENENSRFIETYVIDGKRVFSFYDDRVFF